MTIDAVPTAATSAREAANRTAVDRLRSADPVLVGIERAGVAVPGMHDRMILTSGAPLEPMHYTGGQRRALLYGAVYEGLAEDLEDADRRLASGDIEVGTCHAHGCVGSVAGIYTASMPVFVVEDRATGTRGFCNFYEGESRRRLNYGAYDDDVRDGLRFIERVVAPVMAAALQHGDGLPLRPIMSRALHMGDELHSRNTAATTLMAKELTPHLLELALDGSVAPNELRETVRFLHRNDYFFLRLSMAAAKATADAAHGIERSSIVSAMTIDCRGFSVRISGLGDTWFRGPHPIVEAKLFEPFTTEDIEWIGGESHITETVGLGGFAQAAAFALQAYQGGSPQAMARENEAMYAITAGEHEHYRLPYFGYRGTPVGIDVFRVLQTGVLPVIDGGLAGRDGGQIGAGILRAPREPFELAAEAYAERYPTLE